VAIVQPPVPLGDVLPLWSVAPFILLLVAVSALEVFAAGWWGRLANKAIVASALAIPTALYLAWQYQSAGSDALLHSMTDYVSFIVLLTALFVISGGVQVTGSLAGTPLANMGMLAIGAVLANLIGTTGASMVLIRPFLRANAIRRRKAHLVVFFIVIVANTGGLLTPLGDPPLFLGYLKGVPFAWTLGLWGPWLLVNALALVVFNLVDQFMVNREEKAERREGLLDELMVHEPLRVRGLTNVAFLVVVVLVLVGRGSGLPTNGDPWPFGVQEALLVGITIASYRTTSRAIHDANHFSFAPMASVAIVFLAIFVTMTAPLLILNARSASLGLTEPWHFFWATGALSGVLDNAPTYLTLTAVGAGQLGVSAEDPTYLASMLTTAGGPELLAAISCGAVFMGCLTYIGNGPNLMVKEIAEHRGIRMPNFFAYALAVAVVMIPVFLAPALVSF
jgi:Na+/H+ antiporter NhaD/arsenite permease-like protein